MSRLTGNDAKGLMEAYSAVYAPQELTEEQVWEEVENWVNSLVEEGYDLSEYTWEEMYESYLSESSHLKEFFGPGMEKTRKGSEENKKYEAEKNKRFRDGGGQAALDRARGRRENLSRDDVIKRGELAGAKYKSSSDGKMYASYNDAEAARKSRLKNLAATQAASRAGDGGGVGGGSNDGGNKPPKGDVIVKAAKGGVPGSLNKTTGKWTSSDGGKVSPTKPTGGATPPGGAERRAATSAELRAAQQAREKSLSSSPNDRTGAEKAAVQAGINRATKVMGGPEGPGEINKADAERSKQSFKPGGPTGSTPKPAVSPTPAAKTTPTPVTPKPNLQQSIKANRGLPTIRSSYEYDAYDLVLEYLLSQGHADTLEEAHYVMMEMDAEMIGTIVEAPGEWFGGLRDKARASRASQIQSMQPTPKPLPSIASPFAKPASRTDSGKLTTYGAGGGAEAERRGQTRDQVMKQGAINRERKNKPQPVNQGPDFGR